MALADIIAGQDAVYAAHGVAATWTPSGGVGVPCTALVFGGDQAAQFHGLVGQVNVEPRSVKVRVRELLAATETVPLDGDSVSVGADIDTLVGDQVIYVITGDPRQEDPRRLEWTFDLGDA